jgi:hypothetical protein
MMQDKVFWLTSPGNCRLKLVWVDDLFIQPQEKYQDDRFLKRNREQYPAIGPEWLGNFVLTDSSTLSQSYARRLRGIRQCCLDREVRFGITNFEFASEIFTQFDTQDTLWLIDIENIFAEDVDLSLSYGFHFGQRHNIPIKRRRFYTRIQGMVFDIGKNVIGDLDEKADFLSTSSESKSTICGWFDSLLIHPDPVIADAISFFGRPWSEEWEEMRWTHDGFDSKKHLQAHAFTNWLQVDLEALWPNNVYKGESGKCALMWPGEKVMWGGWDEAYSHRNGRLIQGRILNALLRKLGIHLEEPLPEQEWFRMPCDPCLPFLVSLRSFLWELARNGPPADYVRLRRYPGDSQCDVYLLTVGLAQNGGQAWGLMERFFEILPSMKLILKGMSVVKEPDAHPVARALVKMMFGITSSLSQEVITNYVDEECHYLHSFANGPGRPVVAIDFGPHQVNLLWTALRIE